MKLRKGDLVEVEHESYNHTGAPKHLVKGIVKGTEKDWWVITDHIDVKGFIIPVSSVKRVIKRQAIPEALFKYLEGSLYER